MANAVSNAGPLIHLAQVGLRRAFEKVFVPIQVVKEATVAGRADESALRALPNMVVLSVPGEEIEKLPSQLSEFHLQEGELAALALNRQLNESVCLTDDLEVRNAAAYLGLEPHGSAGVITLACQHGLISLAEAKQGIMDLFDKSNLFITRTIIDLALAELDRLTQQPETKRL